MNAMRRGRKYTIEDAGGTLTITSAPPKSAAGLILSGGIGLASLGMFAVGVPWPVLVIGVPTIVFFFLQLFLKEVVEVGSHSIDIWVEVLGIRLGSQSSHWAERVSGLRVVADANACMVAFNDRLKTVTFGPRLGPAEAQELVSEISRRYPRYQRDITDRDNYVESGATPPRHRAESSKGKLSITVPSPKNPAELVVAIAWLPFWLVVWKIVVGRAAPGAFTPDDAREGILWVSLWALITVQLLYRLLWQLAGWEEIEVGRDTISIRKVLLGMGKARKYERGFMSGLRLAPGGGAEPELGGHLLKFTAGLMGQDPADRVEPDLDRTTGRRWIAFDYHGKTIRIVSGVEEAEARQILAEILSHFPEYSRA